MAKTRTSFKKGEAKGKPKGAKNHTTRDIKEAYRLLIEKNLDKMNIWLEKIAEKDPAKAMSIILGLSEYVIPKLARNNIDLNSDSDNNIYAEMSPEEFEKQLARANRILGYEPIDIKLSKT
jgi:hypothetical protein